MKIIIRKGSLADYDGIREVEKLSFKYPYSEGYLKALLSGEQADIVYVAEDRGKIIGYIIARVERRRRLDSMKLGEKVGHIISLAVHPDYRGQGIGKVLMEKALEKLKEMGCKSVYLEVRVSNAPAINLYRKLGFKVKRVIPLYYRDGEDAFVLEKTL